MATLPETTARRLPPGLRAALAAGDWLGRMGGILAVLCLVALLLLILLDVFMGILDKLGLGLPISLTASWEFSSYLMGAVFLFGAAAGVQAGSHVRVSVLLARTRGVVTGALEVVSTGIGLFVTGYLAYALFNFTQRAYVNEQLSSGSLTPLWIPDALLTLGALVMAIQFAVRLLRIACGLPPDETNLQVGSGE